MSRSGGVRIYKRTGRPVNHAKAVFSLLSLIALWSLLVVATGGQLVYAQEAQPQPTVDPLDVPQLPDNPTQIDVGRNAYYYNCMPCHGDHGQGLTDEWRQTWVDDHQDCWARGCHGGRIEDEGFPLPATIPAVAGPDSSLTRFSNPAELHDYLVQTHPPQRPGALPDEEYWALTAFVLNENGRLPAGKVLNKQAPETSLVAAVLLTLGVLAGAITVFLLARTRHTPS